MEWHLTLADTIPTADPKTAVGAVFEHQSNISRIKTGQGMERGGVNNQLKRGAASAILLFGVVVLGDILRKRVQSSMAVY
jgi:hypothetical protein